jgi:hypothetical protein
MLFTEYYYNYQIKKRVMGRTRSTNDRGEKCIKNLVGKLEKNRPFGRPKRSFEDNIKMDLIEIESVRTWLDSSGSGQGPVAGCCEYGNEPSVSVKDVEFLDCGLFKICLERKKT